MSEEPDRGRRVRRIAYLLLAVAAAIATPSLDVLTILEVFVVSVAVFELGFFAYRRWRKRE